MQTKFLTEILALTQQSKEKQINNIQCAILYLNSAIKQAALRGKEWISYCVGDLPSFEYTAPSKTTITKIYQHFKDEGFIAYIDYAPSQMINIHWNKKSLTASSNPTNDS